MAASIYQLPTISADTNAGTGAMAGASQSFSHAGTVFGELRKSILDEEQRAIENASNEKKMAEQIRQFNEQLGWNKDKFAQDLGFRREELDETRRYHSGSLANQAAGLALQRQEQDFLRQKWAEGLRREDEARQRLMRATYEASGQADNDQQAAYQKGMEEAFGADFFKQRQDAQNYIQRYETAKANGLSTDTLGGLNTTIHYQNAKRILDNSNRDIAAYKTINPEPTPILKDTSSLGRTMHFLNVTGDMANIQNFPMNTLMKESLEAQQKQDQAARKEEADKRLAYIKANANANARANKDAATRRELFGKHKINDSYYGWLDDNMTTLQNVASEQYNINLSDKDALGILENTYNFKPESTVFGLFKDKSSPAGVASILNIKPSNLTPEEIIEGFSDNGRTIRDMLLRKILQKQRASK